MSFSEINVDDQPSMSQYQNFQSLNSPDRYVPPTVDRRNKRYIDID